MIPRASAPPALRILGIESSCDETAVAILELRAPRASEARILSERLFSQSDAHAVFGGVVPEIAARAHLERLPGLLKSALREAGCAPGAAAGRPIDLVAATTGPGLVGGLMVGATFGRALAYAWGCPFFAVNHLAAHALSPRLRLEDGADAESPDGRGGELEPLSFPYLLLLASGGHCQLLGVEDWDRFRLYGQTLDDAAGEAFDKAGRLLGLGWPGGPAVARAAERFAERHGEAQALALSERAVRLPRPLSGRAGCDFSFSGLKTSLARASRGGAEVSGGDLERSRERADAMAFAFQERAVSHLAERAGIALGRFRADYGVPGPLVAAGGVASNERLRLRLEAVARAHGTHCRLAPRRLCTDNGVMVAFAAAERWVATRSGGAEPVAARAAWGFSDDMSVRPRWPLAVL